MSAYKLQWEIKKLQLKEVFTISRSSRSQVPVVLMALSKGGITGYGEASPNARYNESAEKTVAELNSLPGSFFDHITQAEELSQKADALAISQSTKAAMEMGWLDWQAKSEGVPLWKQWGFEQPLGPVSSYTIGIDTPKKMQQKVLDASQYPVYKIKLGTDHDRELIKAIREVTDHPLRVDANEGWTSLDEAKREIEFLAGQNVELIEQPMPSTMRDDMKELKDWSPLPLCADESFIGGEQLEDLAEGFDVLNIKLMKIGSLIKARKVIQEAHASGLEIMIGCMIESSLANSAGGLLALDAEYCDLDGHILINNDPFKGFGLNADYRVCLSDAPGFGVQLR